MRQCDGWQCAGIYPELLCFGPFIVFSVRAVALINVSRSFHPSVLFSGCLQQKCKQIPWQSGADRVSVSSGCIHSSLEDRTPLKLLTWKHYLFMFCLDKNGRIFIMLNFYKGKLQMSIISSNLHYDFVGRNSFCLNSSRQAFREDHQHWYCFLLQFNTKAKICIALTIHN